MRLIWTPNNGEKREFSFQPAKLVSAEAEAIEDAGGPAWDSFEEFGQKFLKGNRRAYRAALWVMLRREQPALRFTDLSLRVDEVEVDFDAAETARLREQIFADPDMDAEQRAHLLAIIDPDGDTTGADAEGL